MSFHHSCVHILLQTVQSFEMCSVAHGTVHCKAYSRFQASCSMLPHNATDAMSPLGHSVFLYLDLWIRDHTIQNKTKKTTFYFISTDCLI